MIGSMALKIPDEIVDQVQLLLLREAEVQLQARFGQDVQLDLEPDWTGHHMYWMNIRTKMNPVEADKALNSFDQEWWLHNLHRANGRLEFSLQPLADDDTSNER